MNEPIAEVWFVHLQKILEIPLEANNFLILSQAFLQNTLSSKPPQAVRQNLIIPRVLKTLMHSLDTIVDRKRKYPRCSSLRSLAATWSRSSAGAINTVKMVVTRGINTSLRKGMITPCMSRKIPLMISIHTQIH